MAVVYICRHCGLEIGRIQDQGLAMKNLGFHILTSDERIEMIDYKADGNIRVKVICEDCQEALERNPFYHLLDPFIQ